MTKRLLTPLSKFIVFILTMIAALITNDTRFLAIFAMISFVFYRLSKLKYHPILILLIFSHLTILFVLNPDYGTQLYDYSITWIDEFSLQEMLYLLNILLKDVIILNFFQIFFLTSQPVEVAATLNQVGFSYRIAYQISQKLSFFSNLKSDLVKLQNAAAVQYIEISKFKLVTFLLQAKHKKTAAARHFGKKTKRTWYITRKLGKLDHLAILFAALTVLISIGLIFVNGSRLWNPFR
ncbi:ABC transporter permease [Lactococcus hodotermopsidis]|uniref:ABC transporter permease n=1 Tax=Pseudolactococcus hodotermopsidis TaxID=2709157 RepID=A0A6A0BCV5_9LACT|nr:energy-coupling factor transporter transmembrane component T [Lactococcus hodotermopsidis]GFH42264.1 ABC transporter permease [Lactococcus hodotermopsidis]